MNPSARATIWDLSARRFDLLVIGGGITGAGIAREAAHRGLSVALVERGDFASGTSSRSSRLIHGGLRYLEHRKWSLVREALAERGVLLRTAPHLVRPLAFLFPVFATDRVARWKLEAGLTLYDLLALRGNVRRHRALSKRAVLDHEPLLKDKGLRGGSLYWDAQCDDARLALATVRSAARHGAVTANHMCVTALEIEDGRVAGASIEDQLTGAQGTVHARIVVNATGPWTDVIRRLEDPDAKPILRPSRGAHVMVPRSRIGHHHAITFLSPIDGRVMFVLPWGDRSYIGTTDTDTSEAPDQVVATEADMRYLLRSANAIFPSARLALEDVSVSWAGLRPLVAGGDDPGSRSREHHIGTGKRGLITVAGGKLTTYRRMGVETANLVAGLLGRPTVADPMKTRSATEPLPGGDAYTIDALFAEGVKTGLSEPTVAHLVGQYGSETSTIYGLVREWPTLTETVHPLHGAIGAEVVHAVRHEYARRLDDVLFRRLSVGFETPDAGVAAAETVARLMGRELGWDDDRRRAEIDRYREVAGAIPRGRALSSDPN
ncbi:MAG: glycerol-3-phosphate dehydrogenase [Gemmatimonadales bacterium]|nr:glycerol-3-phosphate dehydrogenase [Gemmatimonadales bacterium]